MAPVTRDTVVTGRAVPDLTLEQFSAVLEAASSPALVEAAQCYQVVTQTGVSVAFSLAVFCQESTFGTAGLAVPNKNPGNTRSTTTGIGMVVDTAKGKFVRYPSWREGYRDMAWRLVKPNYAYALEGRRTIAQIIYRWAPPEDGNDTEGYIKNVVTWMNRWLGAAQQPMTNKRTLKIALSAGHHNTDGGSPVEHDITGPLCREYARALRDMGHDVRVITPDDGMGDSPYGLQTVAQKVVDWSNAGWTADLYLETHTQGLGDTSVRGCFGIYPDWGSDIDLGVRNGLAARICQAINRAVGIPVYQAGVMSEKSTGVGISGYRLGIFLRTAAIGSNTTRLIVEHGAHTNRQDLAILQNPASQTRIAQAAAQAIVNYFGDDATMSTNIGDQDVIQMNGYALGHGMLAYWKAQDKPGQAHPLGLPISNEQPWASPDGKQYTVQCFERGILGYDGTVTDPAYRVQPLLIGYEWMAAHLKAA